MSVEQIKTAIEKLSFDERAELAAWFHGWRDDEWDQQMKRDPRASRNASVMFGRTASRARYSPSAYR
jgi:hypothetical protein